MTVSLLAVVFIANEREVRARAAVRSGSAAVMMELKEDIDAAAVAMQEFNSAGGLDLAGLEDKSKLQQRLAAATSAERAVERVLRQGDGAPQRLADALRGAPAGQVEQARAQLPAKMNWTEGREIFETHRRAYAAARAQLEFMHKHHGHWRVDGVGMSVNWNSRDLQAEAEKLAQQVDAARAAQAALSQPTSDRTSTTRRTR